MISVIVPIYKAEQYVHRCIDSILAQSYTDFELLLIDDGSPDSSGAICDEYAAKDCRVRVFHKENGGVSSARNLGLDNARGEYITFCDADDYVGVDWLCVYDEAIKQKLDFAIQGIYYITNNGEIERQRLIPYVGGNLNDKRCLIVRLMNQYVFGYPVTKLFRRQIVEENHIRFDEQSAFREDEQFFSQYLVYVNTFTCIDKENYYYILPSSEKRYKGDACYSLLPIFQSLDIIFDRDLPKEICQIHYVNIKDAAVQYILQGKKLTSYHLDLYRRMVTTLNYTNGIKNKVLNLLILKSKSYPKLTKIVMNIIHNITNK